MSLEDENKVETERFPRRRHLPKMAWQRSIMERCPDCGGHDIAVWQENPHCFECGSELTLAIENEYYGVSERVCSNCGVVDSSFHCIFVCERCGKEHRVRIEDDGQLEWDGGASTNRTPFYGWWETSAPLTKTRVKPIICHGCGHVLRADSWSKYKEPLRCPHCGFTTSTDKYMKEVYSQQAHIRAKRTLNHLKRLLPVSMSELMMSLPSGVNLERG